MAVLDTYPSVKVQIEANGAPLQEYDDDDDDEEESPTPGTVVKYIEAISGAEFQIVHEITPRWPQHDILFQYYVDQHHTGGTFVTQCQYRGSVARHSQSGAISRRNGQEFLHKFQFAALSIVEAETETQKHGGKSPEMLEKMGQIRIQAFHVHNVRTSRNVRDYVNSALTEFGPLAEKALKGRTLSHRTAFGSKQSTRTRPVMDFDHVNPNKLPFATFVFKYRSRAALKSLMVIPRSPSPVPLEDRDIATLTEAEMRELLQRQRERDTVTRPIKSERVKRERSATLDHVYDDYDDEVSFVSAKRLRLPSTPDENGTETIDLT